MRSPVLSLGQNWKSPPARPRLSPVTCHSAVRLSCMLQRIYKGSAAPSAVPLHSAKRIYRLCSACNKIRSRCRAYSRCGHGHGHGGEMRENRILFWESFLGSAGPRNTFCRACTGALQSTDTKSAEPATVWPRRGRAALIESMFWTAPRLAAAVDQRTSSAELLSAFCTDRFVCNWSRVCRTSKYVLQSVYRRSAGIHWMTLRWQVTPRYIFWRPPARPRLSPEHLSSAWYQPVTVTGERIDASTLW